MHILSTVIYWNYRRCEEENDVYVKFMNRNKQDALTWSSNSNNDCWIPFQDILCVIDAPEPLGQSGRNYKLNKSDKKLILSSFSC